MGWAGKCAGGADAAVIVHYGEALALGCGEGLWEAMGRDYGEVMGTGRDYGEVMGRRKVWPWPSVGQS